MARRPLAATIYFGSKRGHLDFILPLLPVTPIYVEPFGGSGAVLLNRPRSGREIWNDLDPGIHSLMLAVRDDPASLRRTLRLTPYSRTEYATPCPDGAGTVERARKLLTRAQQGLFGKPTQKGAGSWGRQLDGGLDRGQRLLRIDPWLDLVDRHRAVHRRLQGVEIENRDALDVIRDHDSPDTLHYLDPPYVADVRVEKAGYAHELPDDGQRALAELLNGIQGLAAVSGYASPLYEELFAGWNVVEDAERLLLSTNHASPRREALWTNYPVGGV